MKEKGIFYYPALILFPVVAAASIGTEIFPQFANHSLSVYAGICLVMYLSGSSVFVYHENKSNSGVPSVLGFLPVAGVAVYLFYLAFTKQNRDVLIELLPLYLLKVIGAVAAGWFGYLSKAYKVLSDELAQQQSAVQAALTAEVPEDKITDLNLLAADVSAPEAAPVQEYTYRETEGEERLKKLIQREKEFLINYMKK